MTKHEARNPNQIRMTKPERALTENKRAMAISRLNLRNLRTILFERRQAAPYKRVHVSGCLAEVIQWNPIPALDVRDGRQQGRRNEPEIFSLRACRIRGLKQERI